MNYYEVAMLDYAGDEGVFTYSWQGELQTGQLVCVSLKNKTSNGIIIKKISKPEFNTKEISKILTDEPVISTNLLELAFWISEYYASSLSAVLKIIIPAGISKKRRPTNKVEHNFKKSEPLKLTSEQKQIYKEILKELNTKPHLIFGVTGSGKTEIYLQLIEKMLLDGKDSIVLVPEIALTPQTYERFESRFPGQVALFHSNMKETEKFDNWKKILDGEKRVIIGPRSALFSPFKNLGLIIIDEEHDGSYKQDKTPRYHATAVAKKLAKISNAGLVLGSATPKIETYFEAKNDEIFLHTLSNRIVQTSMPETKIVDMRNEFKLGNYSIFSEKLQREIRTCLDKKKQIILFLNRRGMSTFVSCRDCGYVESCPNCDIPLTFHYNDLSLTCHHCDFKKKPETICPDCKSLAIKFFGSGTQKVELEIAKLFGKDVKVARFDRDTTAKTGATEETFEKFKNGEIDILIGTQMIAKGWDIPDVHLVGVISADTMLNFPDYTSSEKTFDILAQVAGRTGRGDDRGKVIFQTYNPDAVAIRSAAKHDYVEFYENEIKNRKELSYPPFANLIKLLYNNVVQNKAKEEADRVYDELTNSISNTVEIIGPSPAFIPKMNNKYYYQIILKIDKNESLNITKVIETIKKITKSTWTIDIDPENLL